MTCTAQNCHWCVLKENRSRVCCLWLYPALPWKFFAARYGGRVKEYILLTAENRRGETQKILKSRSFVIDPTTAKPYAIYKLNSTYMLWIKHVCVYIYIIINCIYEHKRTNPNLCCAYIVYKCQILLNQT